MTGVGYRVAEREIRETRRRARMASLAVIPSFVATVIASFVVLDYVSRT
jgi:hypothetical protein